MTVDLTALEAADAALQTSTSVAAATKQMSAANLATWKQAYPPTPPPTSTEYWLANAGINTPIEANPALDPNSSSIAHVLVNAKLANGLTVGEQGGWLNYSSYTATVWEALLTTPFAPVTLDQDTPGVSQNLKVTIPFGAGWGTTADGPDGDNTLVVKCDQAIPAQGTFLGAAAGDYFEFQAFDVTTMHAHAVGKKNVVTGDGSESPVGRVGCLTALFGILTPADVAAGTILHGLRWASPCMAPTFITPAGASDGGTQGGPVPGTSWQLDPTLTTAQMQTICGAALSPLQLMVARCAQTYRQYFGDSSGAFTTYAESTVNATYTPALSAPVIPGLLLSHIRVLAHNGYGE